MNLLTNPAVYIPAVVIIFLILCIVIPYRLTIVFNSGHVKIFISAIKIFDSYKKSKKAKNKDKDDIQTKGANEDNVKTERKIDLNEYIKITGSMKENFNEIKPKLVKMLNFMKKIITLSYYHINVAFGFENAAATGIGTGIVCASVSAAEAFLRAFFTPKKDSNILVVPDFINRKMNINGKVIFTLRFFPLLLCIILGYNIYRHYNKVLSKPTSEDMKED